MPRRIRRTLTTLAVASVATLGGATGVALAHGHGHGRGHHGNGSGTPMYGTGNGGGGKHGRHGDRLANCTLTGDQLLTAQTSPMLAALQDRLDAKVAAGRITQAQADAKFAKVQMRVSLKTLVHNAKIAPLLTLLGMTQADLQTAHQAGQSLRDIIASKGVTSDQVRQALADGRAAAKAALAAACPATTTPKTPTTTTPTTTTPTTTTTGTTTAPAQ
ncbi:MAG: hypothetical protein U0Y82_01120 [Thermoleophilia bacterium]